MPKESSETGIEKSDPNTNNTTVDKDHQVNNEPDEPGEEESRSPRRINVYSELERNPLVDDID